MPDWVGIQCEFTGNQEHINQLFEVIENKEENKVIDFNKIVPQPIGLYNNILFENEEKMFGKENCWYEWNIKNWGTKWNSFDDVRKENTLFLNTAWSFPLPIFENIARYIYFNKLDISFLCNYADEDIGNNTGFFNYEHNEKGFSFYHNELADMCEMALETAYLIWGEEVEEDEEV